MISGAFEFFNMGSLQNTYIINFKIAKVWKKKRKEKKSINKKKEVKKKKGRENKREIDEHLNLNIDLLH